MYYLYKKIVKNMLSEEQSFQQRVLRQLDFHKRMKLDPYLTSYKKINSKCINDLNINAKNY